MGDEKVYQNKPLVRTIKISDGRCTDASADSESNNITTKILITEIKTTLG